MNKKYLVTSVILLVVFVGLVLGGVSSIHTVIATVQLLNPLNPNYDVHLLRHQQVMMSGIVMIVISLILLGVGIILLIKGRNEY